MGAGGQLVLPPETGVLPGRCLARGARQWFGLGFCSAGEFMKKRSNIPKWRFMKKVDNDYPSLYR